MPGLVVSSAALVRPRSAFAKQLPRTASMATAGAKLSPLIQDLRSPGSGETSVPSSHHRSALIAQRMMLVTVDLLSVWCSSLVAIAIRFPLRLPVTLETHAAFLLLYSGLIILFCDTQKLYSGAQFRSSTQETKAVARAVAMASLLLTAFIYASGLKRWLMISRFVVALTMVLSLVAIAGTHWLRRRRLQRAAADGFSCRNVLIVGTGTPAQALYRYLGQHRYLGYVAAGFITAADEDPALEKDVLGSLHNLPEVARTRFIDEVIISTENRTAVKLAITQARACGLGVRVVPDLYDGLAWGAPVEHVGQFPTICLDRKRIPALALMIKRGMDAVCSAAALLVLSPLIVAVALAVKVDSPGPVFYTSGRVGRKGTIFGCHKFRTMVRNADELLATLQHLNERDGVLFKISNDPRITRFGRLLRKYSVDELPQLWNVLKGDMSLVGPRPPIVAEVRQYELDHLKRLDVMPGITGLWQVEARTNPSFACYIALDMEYVDNWNLFLDLKILLKTAVVVVAGTGR
jgi:exopolysaccharide biosynthesis polyprenyl glycosylphosphotransferase